MRSEATEKRFFSSGVWFDSEAKLQGKKSVNLIKLDFLSAFDVAFGVKQKKRSRNSRALSLISCQSEIWIWIFRSTVLSIVEENRWKLLLGGFPATTLKSPFVSKFSICAIVFNGVSSPWLVYCSHSSSSSLRFMLLFMLHFPCLCCVSLARFFSVSICLSAVFLAIIEKSLRPLVSYWPDSRQRKKNSTRLGTSLITVQTRNALSVVFNQSEDWMARVRDIRYDVFQLKCGSNSRKRQKSSLPGPW